MGHVLAMFRKFLLTLPLRSQTSVSKQRLLSIKRANRSTEPRMDHR